MRMGWSLQYSIFCGNHIVTLTQVKNEPSNKSFGAEPPTYSNNTEQQHNRLVLHDKVEGFDKKVKDPKDGRSCRRVVQEKEESREKWCCCIFHQLQLS